MNLWPRFIKSCSNYAAAGINFLWSLSKIPRTEKRAATVQSKWSMHVTSLQIQKWLQAKKAHNFCHHFLLHFFTWLDVCTWKHVRSKSPFCHHVAVKDPKMLLIIFMSNSQKCIIFHCQHSPLSWVLSFICLLWCNLLFWSVMQCSHFPYCSHSHSKKQDFLLWCCIFRYRGFIPWHM